MNKIALNFLIDWCCERQSIFIKKESGAAKPWTADPILRDWRFTNVRREDDKTTRWIAKVIRETLHDDEYLWFHLAAARLINEIGTLEFLIDNGYWPTAPYDPHLLERGLTEHMARENKTWTAAYKTPAAKTAGISKAHYISHTVLLGLWKRRREFQSWRGATLQRTHYNLMKSEGLGYFLAYQVVVDLRFTQRLGNAPDVETWAAAGPGTIRGLNRLHDRRVEYDISQQQALREMLPLYPIIKQRTGIDIDFSDVPNILCEFDKYMRAKTQQGTPKARYRPPRPSEGSFFSPG